MREFIILIFAVSITFLLVSGCNKGESESKKTDEQKESPANTEMNEFCSELNKIGKTEKDNCEQMGIKLEALISPKKELLKDYKAHTSGKGKHSKSKKYKSSNKHCEKMMSEVRTDIFDCNHKSDGKIQQAIMDFPALH